MASVTVSLTKAHVAVSVIRPSTCDRKYLEISLLQGTARGVHTMGVHSQPSTQDTDMLHGCHRSILTNNKEMLC